MTAARVEQQARRIRELLQENEELRTRLEGLEEAISHEIPAFMKMGILRKSECAVLGMMMKRDVVTRDGLMEYLYGTRNAPPDTKIIDVFICNIRKKLRHLGVDIETVFGVGYRLTATSKAIIRNIGKVEVQ